MSVEPAPTPKEVQFNTSSTHKSPDGYPRWVLRNDYPPPRDVLQPIHDAPWLNVMKEYCFEDMTNNNFVPQDNKTRDWYHAPWMHYGPSGREPLHGLTSERYCPPRELSATQQRTTQTWAVGFFNSAGASVFGGMWKDPNNPDWSKNVEFPPGTALFKLLYTNATDVELPNMVGAPGVDAMIAVQPDNPKQAPDPTVRLQDKPAKVRLLQVDIAIRDDRAVTGWVWGTYMYDGNSGQGYDGIIPVGLSWGLDPDVTQEAYDQGARPKHVWFNPVANGVRISLHGGRPSWGWNDRLNGPADSFISACQSCHSTAQWNHKTNSQGVKMTPPKPIKNNQGQYVPKDDKVTMNWFRDIMCGTPFTDDGAVSADHSLQLLIGYENYLHWDAEQQKKKKGAPVPMFPPIDPHRRQGPDMGF